MKQTNASRFALAGVAVIGVLLLSSAVARASLWGLFLDFGTPEGAPSRVSVAQALRDLRAHLDSVAGLPLEQATIVADRPLTRQAIREQIDAFAARVPAGSTVLLYLRATVTKPMTKRSIYFYPGDARFGAPLDASPRPISDSELNEWLAPLRKANVVLFADLRTEDQALGVYFAARQTLGTTAFMVIARRGLPRPLAAYIADVFTDAADTDQDSVLRMEELAYELQQAIYSGDVTSDDVIVAATGIPDLVLTTLPAAIVVTTRPVGATVFVDGEEVGTAPLRYTKLTRKRYEVSVALDGYRRPEPKTVEVARLVGKAYPVLFPLEPVTIKGTVTVPAGAEVGTILLGIRSAGYSTTLDGPGPFAVSWTEASLELGKTYDLGAGTPDDRYFGHATFTLAGNEDIVRNITLEERSAWEIASIRYAAGYPEAALAVATEARNTQYDIPAGLPEDFIRFLLAQWSSQTSDARAMIACATLVDYLGGPKAARPYWKLAKAAAEKGSDDYRYAVQGLRAAGGNTVVFAIAGVVFSLTMIVILTLIIRHRRSFRPRSS